MEMEPIARRDRPQLPRPELTAGPLLLAPALDDLPSERPGSDRPVPQRTPVLHLPLSAVLARPRRASKVDRPRPRSRLRWARQGALARSISACARWSAAAMARLRSGSTCRIVDRT